MSNRGFNQAKLIANKFSTLADIPFKSLLVKKKDSQRQASLHNPGQRLDNLKDTISSRNPNIDLCNKEIILIDDVVSTGATLNACAQILKEQKVKKVIAMTVARS
jgi:predicted amidophosphoribosyltransferase